ncbi:MAG: general secretion pathway protein GspM [Opitutaceae bacterium]|nr:general secretion pathway protein GspM [Opitutaceae bacterium]
MKTFFLSRALREKILLLLFTGLAAFLWLVSLAGRGRVFLVDWRSTAAELAGQTRLLRDRATIEQQAETAVKNLDPGRTLDATRLQGELDAVARQVGLTPTIDSPISVHTQQFTFHTTQISFSRVELESLMRFNDELSKRSPYLGLEQFTLTVDRTNPRLLNASFKVSSTEIKR